MSKRIKSILLAVVTASTLMACGNTGNNTETTAPNLSTEASTEKTSAEMVEKASGDSSSSVSEEASDTGTVGSYTGEPYEIKMAVWSGEWGDKLDRMMNAFNEEHKDDGLTLTIEMQSGDYSNFLGSCAATGEYPDIFILTPYAQVKQYAKNGTIMDLSDEPFVDKVYEGSLASVTYDGKVYGYPANYEYLGVFYNKDLFEKAGISTVPTTPNEFKEDCQKLKDAGIQPIAATWKESWTLKHLLSMLISPFVAEDEEGFVNGLNDGSQTFNQEWMTQVLDFADIIKEYSGSNMMDLDSTSGFNAMATGTAAMQFTGEFSTAVNYAMDNPQNIGVFAVPVSNDSAQNKLGVDVGVTYCVSANTANFPAVQQVLEYLSNPDDPNGYIVINCSAPGAAPPAMPFDGLYDSPSNEDFNRYNEDKMTCNWIYQQYVNGFDVTFGDLFQGYFAGTEDRDTFIKDLNEQYVSYVEANE